MSLALKYYFFSQAGTFRISPAVSKFRSFNNTGEDRLGLCVMCICVTVLYLQFCDLITLKRCSGSSVLKGKSVKSVNILEYSLAGRKNSKPSR